MNGLQIIDLKEASFMDKVLRREPRENAFVEINNLLACVPIFKLDREGIDQSLKKYGVSHAKARSRLLNFYSIIMKYFLLDSKLDASELERLHHLKYILTLEDREIGSVHKNLVQPIFRTYIRNAISDGKLTVEEKERLQNFAERLYIPKEFAKQLYTDEASRFLHSVLNTSLSDGMLSDGEEAELKRIADNLQVELKFSENARKNLERCRYLWKLYTGDLPRVETPIQLRKGERCAVFVNAGHYDVSNPRIPVKYSGYNQRQKKNDFVFNSGVFRKDKMTNKVIRFLDQGNLYFTDRRLLFSGPNGRNYFLYTNLMGGTFYQNGLLIEQKRGRDQFFKFKSDKMHEIKLIFDSLMTKSRQ